VFGASGLASSKVSLGSAAAQKDAVRDRPDDRFSKGYD